MSSQELHAAVCTHPFHMDTCHKKGNTQHRVQFGRYSTSDVQKLYKILYSVVRIKSHILYTVTLCFKGCVRDQEHKHTKLNCYSFHKSPIELVTLPVLPEAVLLAELN